MTPADQPTPEPREIPEELDLDGEANPSEIDVDDEEELLSGPQTIKLAEPLTIKGGRVISELTIQELRARHLRAVPLNTKLMKFGDLLDIGGKLSGEPQKVIDNLCPEDTAALVGIVSRFIARFQ